MWALPASLILPATQDLVFAVRFGVDSLLRVPEATSGEVHRPLGGVNLLVESLIFLPAGAIASAALIFWLRAAGSSGAKRATVLGYLSGLPFAFVGSLLLPLLFDPWIGATLGGAAPWLLFTWLGYRAGTRPRVPHGG